MSLLWKWRIRRVLYLRRKRRKHWRSLRLSWLRWPVFCNLCFRLYWKGELKSSPFFCVNCLLTNAPKCGIIGRGIRRAVGDRQGPNFRSFTPYGKFLVLLATFIWPAIFPKPTPYRARSGTRRKISLWNSLVPTYGTTINYIVSQLPLVSIFSILNKNLKKSRQILPIWFFIKNML